MTRKQPMTLQLQQQWRKDGSKTAHSDEASQHPIPAEAHPSRPDRTTNH